MKMPEVWMVCSSQNIANCAATLPSWKTRGYKTFVLQHSRPGNPDADLALWCEQNPGSPAAFNFVLDRVLPPSADLVVLGSDCLLPDQSFHADEIAHLFFERFPDGFGVMQPLHAGQHPRAAASCQSPFIGRGWIERAYGGYGALHTRYAQYNADMELYWVAKALGSLLERADIQHTLDSRCTPGLDVFTHYRARDFSLLQQRTRMGFPGCNPVGGLVPLDPAALQQARQVVNDLSERAGNHAAA